MVKHTLIATAILALAHLTIADDEPLPPAQEIKTTILAEITAQGQKVNGLALEYESNILSGTDLRKTFEVSTSLDNNERQARSILKAYVNDKPELTSTPHAGKYVIIELDSADSNASLYEFVEHNTQPMHFRTRAQDGSITMTEKKQVSREPVYYGDRLNYQIHQSGYLKLSDGKTLASSSFSQSAALDHIKTPFLDDFSAAKVSIGTQDNELLYRIYKPELQKGKLYPLTIFLHGSGQVGSDNLAHMLSSKGAYATLQYEDGFVLAPQLSEVFDPFDSYVKGQKGGIHWQTENRIQLLFKMIDETLKANPAIDTKRIYVQGLSRGAEGALNLLLKRPDFFAAALLASGREAYTVEWIEGNASAENLAPIKDVPMWFFHSKEDTVSPVQGSRINVELLRELKAPHLRYTEFSTTKAGDNGISNASAHNTWDAVYSSPEIMQWLLSQKKK